MSTSGTDPVNGGTRSWLGVISTLCALCLILSCACFHFTAEAADTYATDTWAQVNHYLAVHPGNSIAVWENASQAAVTNGLVQMTAVGDGTFQSILQLTPGATYNFLYFVKTGANPPAGLKPSFTYYDCVPSGGNIQSGTEALKFTKYDTTTQAPARYGAIGTNFDARRVLTVPKELSPGDTFWVYGNFADRPLTIKNFDANPVDTTTVRLTWEAPYGAWGQNGENFKMADVIAGGTYKVYRNTTGSTMTYTMIKQIPGNETSYLDTGLTANTSYFYVLAAHDAYKGTTPDSLFYQMISDTSLQDTAIPKSPVRVRFKVHNLDLNYVNEHGRMVYMTREDEPNIYFAPRVVGIIRRADL